MTEDGSHCYRSCAPASGTGCRLARRRAAFATDRARRATECRFAGDSPCRVIYLRALRAAAWIPWSSRPGPGRCPEAGQVEVRIQAAGLNFSDVMKALGVYPGDNQSLGAECSGIVQGVGEGVTLFQPGDEVMGIAPHFVRTLQLHRRTAAGPEARTASLRGGGRHSDRIPDGGIRASPAGTYTAGRTSTDSLRIGRRRPCRYPVGAQGRSRDLRHRRRRGEAGLRSGLGSDRVYDSRSLDFAEKIRREGGGVDVVLNSLSGDAMIRSLELLAPHGRFLEIGKTDIYQNRNLDLAPFQRAISYFAIDLDRMFRERPEEMHDLLVEIAAWFESAGIEAAAAARFSDRAGTRRVPAHGAGEAYRQDRACRPAQPDAELRHGIFRGMQPISSPGGLGALGLQVAGWLADGGAGQIFSSVVALPSAERRAQRIAALRGRGADVVVQPGGCRRLAANSNGFDGDRRHAGPVARRRARGRYPGRCDFR